MKLQNTTDFSGCRLKTQIDAKKTFDLFLLIELKNGYAPAHYTESKNTCECHLNWNFK